VGWANTDALFLNGYNAVSGLSLIEAVYKLNASAKINIIVHTPFICPKGDLIFSRTRSQCGVIINGDTCGYMCYINKNKLPWVISKYLLIIIIHIKLQKLTSVSLLRIRSLVEKKISNLYFLNNKVNNWIVFSNDMKDFLARQQFLSKKKNYCNPSWYSKGYINKMPVDRKGTLQFLYAGGFHSKKGLQLLNRHMAGY
jgi:hypothetical protein